MSYKPKKINKNNTVKNKEKDPNKFHLGRNAGTYLLIVLGFVVLVFIYLIFHFTLISSNSYYRLYNDNTYTPFADDEGTTLVEAKDFNQFDINFYCKSFDSKDSKKAKFNVEIVKNDNTGNLDLIDNNLNRPSQGSYVIFAKVSLCANWIPFDQESSEYGFYDTYVEESSKKARDIEVSLGTTTFPVKTNTWPVPVEVSYPDAYLLICYYIKGDNNIKKYIIHYTSNDYIITQKTENKQITSPAH